jgi:hypothetical protein
LLPSPLEGEGPGVRGRAMAGRSLCKRPLPEN